jgi:hypothetical protein
MNKAFVREPEDTGQAKCPQCGSLGVSVRQETLASFLSEDSRRELADTAFFCPFARCEVAYFDVFERTARTDAVNRPIYPKDPEAPICGCFGLTTDEIERDLSEGVVTRVKALLARAKTPEASCLTHSASGQCCVSEVQRYYMRRRGAT